MKRLLSVLVILNMALLYNNAQHVEIEKNVDDQYQEERGPNMKRYSHFYQGLALILPVENRSGAKIEPGRSMEYLFGYRYKFKLLSFYSAGFDLSGRWTWYGIKPEPSVPVDINSNPLSQADLFDKMNLSIASVGGEIYNRINIGKHGNSLGNYLDIGIKEDWNYSRKAVLQAKSIPGDYYSKSRTIQRGLHLIENFSTCLTGRIGIGKFMLYGHYRISNLITGEFTTPELPPVSAGFQMAF